MVALFSLQNCAIRSDTLPIRKRQQGNTVLLILPHPMSARNAYMPGENHRGAIKRLKSNPPAQRAIIESMVIGMNQAHVRT